MRLHTTPRSWSSVLATTLLLSTPFAHAKKDEPSIKSTSFDTIPLDVSYFEDSDTILFASKEGNLYRSADAGEKWDIVDGPPKEKLYEMILHPFDKQRAYYITKGDEHWSTTDSGKSWEKFKTPGGPSRYRSALSFHAEEKDRIIFNSMTCEFRVFCKERTMYTLDHFKTVELLREDTAGCYWAKSTELFDTGSKDKNKDRILCVAQGKTTSHAKDYRLVISDEFFKKSGKDVQEFEPELMPGRTVPGIVNMAVIQKYLVAAATAEATDEMALFISDDSIKWSRAVFPKDHKLVEKAYTILEGTKYSLQIDVMNSRTLQPMGVFLSSNSNGTYFNRHIEHTNRDRDGLVDFEKVSGIQGIVLVNVVDNFKAIEAGEDKKKKIKSKISFDDGRDFHPLTVKKDELHLHSVTELANSGRVFSSPAPGVIMGVGNTGDHLKSYEDGNLYVSDDAGLNWIEALKGPHLYEFGDQGSILLAIKDTKTKEISYSVNHGKDWKQVDLPDEVYPIQLTTTQDSTSLKFLLEASDKKNPRQEGAKGLLLAIDFDGLHEDKCDSDKDFEKWYARVNEKGEGVCLMGHKQWYKRRKADSNCFVKSEFKDPTPEQEDCGCTDEDFECDFNFERSEDRKECKKAAKLIIPEGECKDPKGKFKGSSGWRKIPGNTCDEKKGINKAEPVDRECEDGKSTTAPPKTGKISSTDHSFPAKNFLQIEYLERASVISSGDDETVLMLTEKALWYSNTHGKKWAHLLPNEEITQIVQHPYYKDTVFFLTSTEKVFFSTDRGRNIGSFKAPFPPSTEDGITVMNFHPKRQHWILWIGHRDCPDNCHNVASFSSDGGDGSWRTLQNYVRKCEFIHESDYRAFDPTTYDPSKATETERSKLIYCSKRTHEKRDSKDNPWVLVTSTNFFEDPADPVVQDVVDFATMSEFIVVASKDIKHETLKVESSIDGQRFAHAKWPSNFKVHHQTAYTVLDSSTHSVFLHVTVESTEDHEYGTIVKSNSNGTDFTRSKDGVNRARDGYVDFEKSLGVEGTAVANIVANYKDSNYKKDPKRLRTMITHNDGAEWSYLSPPPKDGDGKSYSCAQGSEKCALHLHGYTERRIKSHTYTSLSAIGLMIGTGSVGEYLADTADTFVSADGGLSWKFAKKGKYMWEFGDQGSIIVLVSDTPKEPVRSIFYSVDEGDHWIEYEFSSDPMHVMEITTLPSDNSRQFLLWGRKGEKLATVNLDFTGLTDKQCKLDEVNLDKGDYYLWTPKHPSQDNDCLFGHVSEYHRKKKESECYNGPMIPHLHDIAQNCTCTRQDFEWFVSLPSSRLLN